MAEGHFEGFHGIYITFFFKLPHGLFGYPGNQILECKKGLQKKQRNEHFLNLQRVFMIFENGYKWLLEV